MLGPLPYLHCISLCHWNNSYATHKIKYSHILHTPPHQKDSAILRQFACSILYPKMKGLSSLLGFKSGQGLEGPGKGMKRPSLSKESYISLQVKQGEKKQIKADNHRNGSKWWLRSSRQCLMQYERKQKKCFWGFRHLIDRIKRKCFHIIVWLQNCMSECDHSRGK